MSYGSQTHESATSVSSGSVTEEALTPNDNQNPPYELNAATDCMTRLFACAEGSIHTSGAEGVATGEFPHACEELNEASDAKGHTYDDVCL